MTGHKIPTQSHRFL